MKLLVIRYGAMGDLLHVSPSLRVAQEKIPALELHFLTSPLYASFLQTWPDVDRVWTYEKASGWKGLFSLKHTLKAQHYDGILNLHPSFKTWVLTRGLTHGQVQTYRKQKFKAKGQALREHPRYHAVEDFYQPFQHLLSLPMHSTKELHPRLGIPNNPTPEGERWIAIIPGVGGKRGNRAWPLERFQALTEELLQDPQTRLLLIGGPDEAEIAQFLSTDSRIENHCGSLSLLETAALLTQCHVAIGGDTGPLHLAAALGIPIVALFGPTDPRRTGPLGHQAIRTLTPPPALECWPCEYPQCPLKEEEHLACMKALSVADVLSALPPS